MHAAPRIDLQSWARSALPPGAIRKRIGVIFFVGMSTLIGVTLAVTVWLNGLVNEDARRLVLLRDVLDGAAATSTATQDATTLSLIEVLLDGGTVPGTDPRITLPTEGDDGVRAAFGVAIAAVASPGSAAAVAALTEVSDQIELRRAGNLGMARGMFAALFLSTTCYLLIGLWFTEELIAKPLEELVHVNYRIAAGDLDTPVVLSESDEFAELAESFEAMRLDLRASRERLATWARELETGVARRTQQLSALAQVVTAASGAHDLEDVLRTALDQSLQAIDAETGGLWLVDPATGGLQLAVAQDLPIGMEDRLRVLPPGEGATGEAATSGEILVVEDLAAAPDRARPIEPGDGFRSLVAIPIMARERVLGVMDILTRTRRSFASDELALLGSIGRQIGIGVESMRLIEESRAQGERVAALQERDRISAELHDGLLQNLGYLYLQTDRLEARAVRGGAPDIAADLERQRLVLERTSVDIRRFLGDLRGSTPPPRPLQDSLRAMVASVEHETALQVELRMDAGPVRLKADDVAHLERIAREALLNAVRHGGAGAASVTCATAAGEGWLTITDDGAGFDPDLVPADGREHFGLSIMRARAIRLGGRCDIVSAPGRGTRVTVVWPME